MTLREIKAKIQNQEDVLDDYGVYIRINGEDTQVDNVHIEHDLTSITFENNRGEFCRFVDKAFNYLHEGDHILFVNPQNELQRGIIRSIKESAKAFITYTVDIEIYDHTIETHELLSNQIVKYNG